MTARRLSADWLVPVEGEPVRGGALLIDPDGRIAAAGRSDVVPLPPGAAAEHYAGAAILPGLVNTHTHLELTGFAGQVREPAFANWIVQLRALKETRSRADSLAAARQGLADCHAAGVTTIADTGDTGTVIEALAEAGGSGVAYLEVFGPHPDQAEEALAGLERRADACAAFRSARVRLGISPHAPYTVSAPLYRMTARWARERGLPLAVHIAESPDETALLLDGGGAFAERWTRRGIPLPAPLGLSPIAWLELHDGLGPDTLCIHAVQADADDVARLARANAAVALCPLSNRAHAHGMAPLASFLAAGIRVGCGTDSEVSVAPLDLLADVRAARAIGGLDARGALRLCTLGAAEALGLQTEIGSLVPGKWADVAVIGTGDADAIVEAVLGTGRSDVIATWVGGRLVHSARPLLPGVASGH